MAIRQTSGRTLARTKPERARVAMTTTLVVAIALLVAPGADATRRVIVRLRDGSRPFGVADRRRVEQELPVKVTHAFASFPAIVMEVADDADDAAIAAAVGGQRVEPDVRVRMAQTDTQTTPWGISRIRAPEAWARTRGAGVRVGVIDSGVDTDHPDLVGAIAGGYNTLDGEDPSVYEDLLGHGTHVAGTIAAADNGVGVVGVAPDVALYAVRVFGATNEAWVSDIIEGLMWCKDNGMHVVNMSLGLIGSESIAFREAVASANQAGVVMVAAAGNHRATDPVELTVVTAPASYPEAIAVSSVDSTGALSSFSNHGPEVDFAGPGSAVRSTYLGGTYTYLQGTSMACPHVTGAVALTLAAGRSVAVGYGLQLTDDLMGEDTALFADEEGEGVIDAYASAVAPVGVVAVTSGVDVAPSVVYTRGIGNVSLSFSVAETANAPVTVDELRVSITDSAGTAVSAITLDASVTFAALGAKEYAVSTTVLDPGSYEVVVSARAPDWQDLAAANGATNPRAFTVYAAAPIPAGPPDGARVSAPALLEWQGVFGASLYELGLMSPEETTWAVVETADTQHELSLQIPGDYRWRVRAQAAGEWLDYSAESTFSYGLPAPVLTRPVAGGDTYDAAPSFLWDALAEATAYDVQVAGDDAFVGLVGEGAGIAVPSWVYVGDPLAIGSTYYWRARAVSPEGAWSAPSTFRFIRLILTTAASPVDGGTVSPAGGDYAPGDSLTLTALPAAGYVFDGWEGDLSGSVNPVTAAIAADMTVTARFAPTMYALATVVDPANGGAVTPAAGSFTDGDTVALTASPATGYEFVNWDGDPGLTVNPLAFIITGDVTHTAHFALTTHTVTARSEPVDGGAVAPGAAAVAYGSVVEFTATAGTGYTFAGWSGDGSGADNPLAFTVTADTVVVANFVAKPTAALVVGAAEAALNERVAVGTVQLTPSAGADIVAGIFELTYDATAIASLVVDEAHASALGWTVTQSADVGRVAVSVASTTPIGAEGVGFQIAATAATGFWGSADVSVGNVSLNNGAVVPSAASGSVFYPHLSVTAGEVAAPEPASLAADVVVPTGASVVRVAYRRGGDVEFATVELTPAGVDAWVGSLPPSASTARGIAYYVTAVAEDGQEYTQGDASTPFDLPVTGDETIGLTPTLFAPSRWNLVGPTSIPDDVSPGAAFGRVGGAYSPFTGVVTSPHWLAWRWQAAEQEWRPAVAFDQYAAATDVFAPGTPWFLVVDDDPSLGFTLPGRSVDATDDYVAPLRQGWNLLSNPFAYPVDWSDASVLIRYGGAQTSPTHARTQGWVHDRIFWYDGDADAYVPQASGDAAPYPVAPGQGFWLYASVDGAELVIPPVESFPSDPPRPPAAAPALPVNDLWSVSLSCRGGPDEGWATAAVGDAGVALDDAMPPRNPTGVGSRVALLEQVGGIPLRVRRSARPETDEVEWRVEVVGQAGASLTWDIAGVPNEYDVYLDNDEGGRVDLRRRTWASVRELPGPDLTLRAVRRPVTPGMSAVYPNYPNPFNPETWIPFELSSASDVAVTVYGSDGSLVRTLYLGARSAGPHVDRASAAYWDGRTATGETAASGVYFYEVRAAGIVARRRMLLIK